MHNFHQILLTQHGIAISIVIIKVTGPLEWSEMIIWIEVVVWFSVRPCIGMLQHQWMQRKSWTMVMRQQFSFLGLHINSSNHVIQLSLTSRTYLSHIQSSYRKLDYFVTIYLNIEASLQHCCMFNILVEIIMQCFPCLNF